MSKHMLMVQSDDNSLDVIVTITELGSDKKLVSAKCSKRTCITCDYFDEGVETCELVLVRPPAKVIAYGCERWNLGIPF